jgi:flagellum-specific ATP synthase
VHSRYQKSRDLVRIGAYASGSDPALDEAIRRHDGMAEFLQQDMHVSASMHDSFSGLAQALEGSVPA